MQRWKRAALLSSTGLSPFRSAATAGTSAADTQLQISVPAGVQNGDVLLFAIAIRGGSNITNLTLNNWTNLFTTNQSTNVQVGVFWRLASNEPASYTATWTTSGNAAGAIYCAAGVAQSNTINISGSQANASSQNVTAPSVVTTVASTLLVFIGGMSAGSSFTPPSGMSERVDVQSTAGATNCALEIADQVLGATGATGTRVAVSVATGGNVGGLVAVALA